MEIDKERLLGAVAEDEARANAMLDELRAEVAALQAKLDEALDDFRRAFDRANTVQAKLDAVREEIASWEGGYWPHSAVGTVRSIRERLLSLLSDTEDTDG